MHRLENKLRNNIRTYWRSPKLHEQFISHRTVTHSEIVDTEARRRCLHLIASEKGPFCET
jgi:hypothetical protein